MSEYYEGQSSSGDWCNSPCPICEADGAIPKGISVSAPEPNPVVSPLSGSFPLSEDSNPKQQYGDKKVAMHLVPAALTIVAAEALKEGAVKYGPFNWREKKVEALTYVGAIQRHLAAWVDGEDIDPDSTTGKHHLAGAVASMAILLDALHGGQLIDNRPPKGPAGKMILPPKETK